MRRNLSELPLSKTAVVVVTAGGQACRKCSVFKPPGAFSRMERGGRIYIRKACKPCTAASQWADAGKAYIERMRREDPVGLEKQRKAARLRCDYGIDLEDYERMVAEQGGACAICMQPERGKFGKLVVDHDHVSDIVRGLLCQRCNHMVGHSREDPAILHSAIEYLAKWNLVKAKKALPPMAFRG